MSANYFIDAKCKVKFSFSVVESIVNRITKLGGKFNKNCEINETSGLSKNQAIDWLFSRSELCSCGNSKFNQILISYEEDWFSLSFVEEAEGLLISFYFDSPGKKKFFREFLEVNFSYYIKLFLSLIEDFPLMDLEASIIW